MERITSAIGYLLALAVWPLILLDAVIKSLPLGGIFCVIGIALGGYAALVLGPGLQLTGMAVVYLGGMLNTYIIDKSTPDMDITGNIVAALVGSGILLGAILVNLL